MTGVKDDGFESCCFCPPTSRATSVPATRAKRMVKVVRILVRLVVVIGAPSFFAAKLTRRRRAKVWLNPPPMACATAQRPVRKHIQCEEEPGLNFIAIWTNLFHRG